MEKEDCVSWIIDQIFWKQAL